jgi:hypothetical protein
MIIKNVGKNPNELHDYLILNNCFPSYLGHNAKYNENGEQVVEATEIYIEIEAEKEQQLTDLVNQFMTQ